MKLILASASPRRAEILRNAGIQFEISSAGVDESPLGNELPGDYVRRLALAKALSAAEDNRNRAAEALVIGADTIVALRGEILGKPSSPDDARRMLRRLSGNIHEVHTGLALLRKPEPKQYVVEETTRVHFAALTDREIEGYLATGEPFDKAGAYAIQGVAGRYVTRIEGCFFNVMGLPLARLYSLLRECGGLEDSLATRDATK
jgi:septum formation protein